MIFLGHDLAIIWRTKTNKCANKNAKPQKSQVLRSKSLDFLKSGDMFVTRSHMRNSMLPKISQKASSGCAPNTRHPHHHVQVCLCGFGVQDGFVGLKYPRQLPRKRCDGTLEATTSSTTLPTGAGSLGAHQTYLLLGFWDKKQYSDIYIANWSSTNVKLS